MNKLIQSCLCSPTVLLVLGALFGTQLHTAAQSSERRPTTSYVNPFIGTANDGNTHPGAVVPWGLVAVSPHTKDFRQRATGPAVYQYGDAYIYGFGTVNLSGLGCPAAGSIPIKISQGPFKPDVEAIRSSYEAEVAQPGYYRAFLKKHRITAEATATVHTGMYRFTAQSPATNIFLDLGANMSHVKGGKLQIRNERLVTGYQWDGNFCGTSNRRKMYFALMLQTAPDTILVLRNDKVIDTTQLAGEAIGVAFLYRRPEKTAYQLKIGVSFVSEENALLNLKEEQPDFNFDRIRVEAQQAWEKQLSKIQITGSKAHEKTTFYSALYHTLLLPQVFSDVNGEYPTMESDSVGVAQGYTRYTTYSLWDTYRTLHPLLTLVYPQQQRDMLVSMISMAKENGWLPKWELFGQETGVMVGDPALPVVVDSYRKGIRNIDIQAAYRAMKKSATQRHDNPMRPGVIPYWKLGYIPIDDRGGDPADFTYDNGIVWGPVSTTLEYNLADFNVAQLAKILSDDAMYQHFWNQSHSFNQLYDSTTALLRPKNKDGSWLAPFSPTDRFYDIRWKKSGGPGYVEGTAWQYRFFVPHAIDSLQRLMGRSTFSTYLDRFFAEGHFDMTNEPDIGYPYLYNYLPGREAETHRLVSKFSDQYFYDAPDGLPGNDDAGTLSAWLVFSYLGIYPDVPGKPVYQLTTPKFKRAVVQLDSNYYQGQRIVLEKTSEDAEISHKITRKNSADPIGYSLSHQTLVSGAHLIFHHRPEDADN